jgi:hypothetical protein
MDRQYEHVFVGDSNYHGFLSDNASECIDPLAEKRMRQFQISNRRSQIEKILNLKSISIPMLVRVLGKFR